MIKKFMTKDEISEYFSVNKGTLGNDLTAMRRLSKFSNYIINPTVKRVLIDPIGYEKYLRWKQEQR
ncbi:MULTISPECIES: DNA-binding protein [Lactococcus]|uniref:DNA-binding protein n=1 Tax=Lactococcus allomyrinae TaxID=2419773 RepID=A0A387BKQ7_9LACT|nr:DNA-binding protein [Lactococcus allomyrinae]AYG01617.1 DNA-binding protein [Lactococcus allomyrinae]